MADEIDGVQPLSFKLDPAGKELSVNAQVQGRRNRHIHDSVRNPGPSDQVRTGNIESTGTAPVSGRQRTDENQHQRQVRCVPVIGPGQLPGNGRTARRRPA